MKSHFLESDSDADAPTTPPESTAPVCVARIDFNIETFEDEMSTCTPTAA